MKNTNKYPKQIAKTITLVFAILITAPSFLATAQTAPLKEWDAQFGGSKGDYSYSLLQTADGGYLVGGYSNSGTSSDKTQASQGSYDYWIIKTDAYGAKQWDAAYGGSLFDYFYTAEQTTDGGYILGGWSFSGISGDKTQACQGGWDYWIVKTDANGVKQWDATFGGSGNEYFYYLQQTADGGYIVGGYSESGIGGDKTQASQGARDYWIVKTDANGVKQWDATFGGSDDDELWALKQTADGGYILGGTSESGISSDKTQVSQGEDDYWIVKTDAGGLKQWDATFGGSSDEYFYYLQQTADGGYILGGISNSGISGDKTQASQGGNDYWIVKTGAGGVKQWDATFGGSKNDQFRFLQQTFDGGYILGGWSLSGISGDKTQASQGGTDYWIVKTDAYAAKQWDATFGGSDNDYLNVLVQTADGGYILAGTSASGISGEKTQASQGGLDYWIVKVACNGGLTFYADADGDTYGNASVTITGCIAPQGYVINGTDCNDAPGQSGAAIHPGATDVCNGIDDNCDGTIDENAITATVIPSGTLTICDGSSISLAANSGTGITYQWIKGSKNISGATNQTYPANKAAGYKVQESNSFGCSSTSAVTTVNVNPRPSASITYPSLDLCGQSSVTLTANSGTGLTYQWLKGGSNIIGATNQICSANKKGSYKVIVTNSNGCTQSSTNVTVTKSCKESSGLLQQISFEIYPNPARDHATIQFTLLQSSHVYIEVYDVSGKEIETLMDGDVEQGEYSVLLNTNQFSKGVYLVKMISDFGIENQKLIVQ